MRNMLFKKWVFDDIFDDVFSNDFSMEKFYTNALDLKRFPDVDIKKNENSWSISVGIPGLTKEDVKVTTKNGILSISYEKQENTKSSRFVSSFDKSYKIPDNVSVNEIKATVKDGILEVSLPFTEKEEDGERVINID